MELLNTIIHSPLGTARQVQKCRVAVPARRGHPFGLGAEPVCRGHCPHISQSVPCPSSSGVLKQSLFSESLFSKIYPPWVPSLSLGRSRHTPPAPSGLIVKYLLPRAGSSFLPVIWMPSSPAIFFPLGRTHARSCTNSLSCCLSGFSQTQIQKAGRDLRFTQFQKLIWGNRGLERGSHLSKVKISPLTTHSILP